MHILDTVCITLPIPPRHHHPELYALFGDGLLPDAVGGLRDLVLCVLEHPDNPDEFMQGIWDVIHNFMDNVEEPEHNPTVNLVENAPWVEVDAQLSVFYREYLAVLRDLAGPERWVLDEVLDATTGTGVVVRLARHDGWYVHE